MIPVLLGLLACADAPPSPVSAPAERPNILLIDIDTLSADRMDARYGDEWVLPTLHGIADRGVRFSHAISQAGWTVPAVASLLTGRYPLAMDLSAASTSMTDKDARLLPGLLSMYGYSTHAIWSPGVPVVFTGMPDSFANEVTRKLNVGDEADPFATYEAWIDNAPKQPYFLLVHDFDLQVPGDAMRMAHAHDFGDEGIPCYPSAEDDSFRMLRPLVGTDRARNHTLRHYDAVAHTYDALLGRLLTRLDEAGLLSNTIVIATSNHGQDFAVHSDGVTHGAVFDTVLRVPLIMAGPGIAKAGRVVDTPVQTVDVAPTLLDLAGIPVDRKMVGQSLAPVLAGAEPTAALHDRAIYSMTNDRTMSVRTPSRKLVMQDWGDRQITMARREVETALHDRRFNYYDLKADPDELHDLFPTQPEKALDLVQALMGFRADRRAASAGAPVVDVDPAMREIFRKNGYWSIVDAGSEAGDGAKGARPAPASRHKRRQALPQ